MKTIYKDDGSYTVAVETLFDSDLAEYEELFAECKTKQSNTERDCAV